MIFRLLSRSALVNVACIGEFVPGGHCKLLYFEPVPFFLVRNGQFPAAFGPATGQYVATIGSGHALAEAMFVFPLAVRWLKCSFHAM